MQLFFDLLYRCQHKGFEVITANDSWFSFLPVAVSYCCDILERRIGQDVRNGTLVSQPYIRSLASHEMFGSIEGATRRIWQGS